MVERVTSEVMAQLHENMLRVTKGNPEGNLTKVTLENDSSINNNIINNTRVTLNMEEREGSNSVCNQVVGKNLSEFETHAKTQVTPSQEKQGYPHGETGQPITKTEVTSDRLPLVRVGYPQTENNIRVIGNKGYPSPYGVANTAYLLPLLRQALVKLAKEEYHSTVLDLEEFVRDFNGRTPDYKKSLGSVAVGNEARKLKMRGWRF
jgi:hypothetical protein